ncbi:hypothetical protein GALMADRAFT_265045 [Galerina marginata CBS 339.88]|uniref:DUF6593 domain-containing protein n=1 Tax=Galerina marginata (strain CBS 339.88) TaxID=685588 RepID=A0A067TG17_GALM3|nr:hypothetical protein GALMADRAFT_265045 [Galerina marginata CBS 339.88]
MYKQSTDSENTLLPPEPTISLVFSTPSVTNSTVLVDARPIVKISTTDAAGDHTTVSDAQTKELLVDIQHHTLRSDTVTFTHHFNGKPLKLKEWLKEKTLEDGRSPAWAMETSLGSLVWRPDVSFRLALRPVVGGEMAQPIAWAHLQTHSTPLTLLISCGTQAIRDEIVASFIVLEQRMRMSEKGYAKADGWFAVHRTVLGHTAHAEELGFGTRR